jgi:hypothetical protein
MNNRLIYFIIILVTACGKNKPDGNTSGRFDDGLKNCNISITKADLPAVIGRKAFEMSSACKINNEEILIKFLQSKIVLN